MLMRKKLIDFLYKNNLFNFAYIFYTIFFVSCLISGIIFFVNHAYKESLLSFIGSIAALILCNFLKNVINKLKRGEDLEKEKINTQETEIIDI